MIAFYYGLTGFACVYYRRELLQERQELLLGGGRRRRGRGDAHLRTC